MTPSDSSYFIVPLTNGQFAKISNHRYVEMMGYKWCARWSKNASGFYAIAHGATQANGKRSSILMHRLVMGLGIHDGKLVDHINGDTLDNRDENLRLATHSQNGSNRRIRSDNQCGYKGVTQRKGTSRWQAQIRHNQKTIHLGYYESPFLAHTAYCEAAQRLFGVFWRPE